MKRIAIFTDLDLAWRNDVTTSLRAMLLHTPEDLHARVFTAGDLPTDTDEYFAAASIGVPLPWDRRQRVFWPRLRPFARELRAANIQVIHVTSAGPIGVAGRWLATRASVPVVGSVHTSLHGRFERVTRWTYSCCDPILSPSRPIGEWLAARGLARVQSWRNGVDGNFFTPARASSALRQTWHVDHRRPAILVPLTLLTSREMAMLDPIRRGLHRHAIAHQFVFIGARPANTALRERYPDAVFVDALSDDERAIVMASADVCLLPSVTDVVGGTVLEAQASGLPVIVPNIGAAVEHIVAGRTGCAARAFDVDDTVSCLAGLLRQAVRRTEMSRAARLHALEHDWPTMLRPLHAAWRAAGHAASHEAA